MVRVIIISIFSLIILVSVTEIFKSLNTHTSIALPMSIIIGCIVCIIITIKTHSPIKSDKNNKWYHLVDYPSNTA